MIVQVLIFYIVQIVQQLTLMVNCYLRCQLKKKYEIKITKRIKKFTSHHQRYISNQRIANKIVIEKNSQQKSIESPLTNDSSPKIQITQFSTLINSSVQIYWHLRDLVVLANYGINTYICCLKLLKILNFNSNINFSKKIAATIFSIVSKLTQTSQISLKQLVIWGQGQFNLEQLILIESQLLQFINYEMPDCGEYENYPKLCQQLESIFLNY